MFGGGKGRPVRLPRAREAQRELKAGKARQEGYARSGCAGEPGGIAISTVRGHRCVFKADLTIPQPGQMLTDY